VKPKGPRHNRKELIARIEEKAQSVEMLVAVRWLYEHPLTLQERFQIGFQNKTIDLEFSKKEITFHEDYQNQIDMRISEALETLLLTVNGS